VRGQWTLTLPADVGFVCDNDFVKVAKLREPINNTALVTTFMRELSTVTSLIPYITVFSIYASFRESLQIFKIKILLAILPYLWGLAFDFASTSQ
jgi:hypothetical protein